MKTITLKDAEAKVWYKTAPDPIKQSLENLYGKNFFSEKITDRIKTFEDACDELSIASEGVLHEALTDDEIAYRKLKIIIQALNEGWTPDWTDKDEYKYYPWFDLSSGSVLVSGLYSHWYTNSYVGSRLCFKSRELAEYAGKQFIDIYETFFLIPKNK